MVCPGGYQANPHDLTATYTVTEYNYTEDYLKRKTIEKYISGFVDWPPCS